MNTVEAFLEKFNLKYDKRPLSTGFAYKLFCSNGDSYSIKLYNDNSVSLEINCDGADFFINGCKLTMNSQIPLRGPLYISLTIFHGTNQFNRLESSEIQIRNLIYNN